MAARIEEILFNKNASLTVRQKHLCKEYVNAFLMLHNWKTFEEWYEENPEEVERLMQGGMSPKETYDLTLSALVDNIMRLKNLLRKSYDIDEIKIKWVGV